VLGELAPEDRLDIDRERKRPSLAVLRRVRVYGVLGLLLMTGASLHFAVLSKLGINGWTGEPRDRFEALLRESKMHGETRTILKLARDLLPRRR
jgi:hypothetical protein